ncbi:sensor histidine kinase [Methylomarinum vadi]|uniref:sensor histidine kinase n=1 Tax=Methylomarinum vadi TaxID=438855 RepID=UPI0004DEF95A|nr:ATP-binding protein [Methylomarinum vadi]
MKAKYLQFSLPIWIPVSLLGALLLISLIIQLLLAWQSLQRIEPVSRHMAHLEDLQAVISGMEEGLANLMPADKTLDTATRRRLQRMLQQLLEKNNHLAATTPDNIRVAQLALTDNTSHPKMVLLSVLNILRKTFRQEASAHQVLTNSVSAAAKFEVELGVIIMIALPLGAVATLYLMRKRIFNPLQQMSYLMELLGNRQYQQVSLRQVDPGFKPILENYNAMVVRLSELEDEHLQYQRNLEQQVEQAARTLIELQRNLAHTEHLASLGEITARLVHELRNPLAGIKMACINLKKKLTSGEVKPDSLERIDLVINEIDRIISTLNQFLQQAHHDPEPLQNVHIDSAINDLLTLARYQIPNTIQLQYHGKRELICRLPDVQFRQALLNLILNAQQAMGDCAGQIDIRAEYRDDFLVISVCDEGPGFSAEFLHDGIREFATRRSDGTGLGLAMVKRFVRNHEGDLIIHNREPHGACVEMKLNCSNLSHV